MAVDGLLDLHFAVAPDGRTYVVRRESRFPLRMTTPMYLDPQRDEMAFVYVQNPTGGVFAGDRLHTMLELGVGAHAHVTTQAATKVYWMEAGHGHHAIDVSLARDSYLELVPDLVIPQSGSRLVQTLHVEIAKGATFFGTELLAPGRLARGETFEYARVELQTRVFDEARVELLADTLLFEPARRSPTRRGLAGGRCFVGTALVLAPGRNVDELAETLDSACQVESDADAAACLLPGDIGVAVRALAQSHRALRAALDATWKAAREKLVGAPPPPRRK